MIRRARRLLILLAVLLVIVVVSDRVALRVAQSQLQKQVLTRATWSGGTTTVKIHGFPFLSQVVTGSYGDIEVRAEGVTIQDLNDVTADVHLHGVHLPLTTLADSRDPKVPIDRVDGAVTVPYGQLAQRAVTAGASDGIKSLSLRQDGLAVKVSVVLTIPLIGLPISASASAALSLDGDKVRLKASGVDISGATVPAAVTSAVLAIINSVLASSFTIPALPYGLQIIAVKSAGYGIEVTAAARNVVL
jgi:hypothetical protein